MKKINTKKCIDVYVDFEQKIAYYKLCRNGKRLRIERNESLEKLPSGIKNIVFVKHIDTMEIKKVEVPKNISDKLLKSLVEKESGEEGGRYITNYWTVQTGDTFKTLNVIKRDISEFYQLFAKSDLTRNVAVFTYTPFAMLYYNQQLGAGNVLHIHLYENNLFLLFSINGIPEFYRFTKLGGFEEIYENIILTYRYITTSIDNVDLVLLSFDTGLIDYENLYQTLNKEIAVINPDFYIERDPENPASPNYNFVLPAGAVLSSSDCNFIPQEIVQEKNFNFLVKNFSIVLTLFIVIGFLRLLFVSSSMVNEFLDIQAKASEVNLKIKSLTEVLERKDIEILTLKNRLNLENHNQNTAINNLLKYQDILNEDNLKITITKTERGFQVRLNMKKKFSSFQEMDSFCNRYSKVASVSKDYNDKSVEVTLIYDVP